MKSLFRLNKEQRKGIIVLLVIIVTLQFAYFYWKANRKPEVSPDATEWVALQSWIDSVSQNTSEQEIARYPFNPNFITEYKAYQLGLSADEYKRLADFRAKNLYVNSANEFQKITGINDSLLDDIAPYFKFPEWINRNKNSGNYKDFTKEKKSSAIAVLDLNEATSDDLVKVYGVGPATSQRILDYKNQLGGFVSLEQLHEVWGLKEEVIVEIEKHFEIKSIPELNKLKINVANTKQLSAFPYFSYQLARDIVTYRSMNSGIHSVEDLTKIKGFPVEKLKIIALYLEF